MADQSPSLKQLVRPTRLYSWTELQLRRHIVPKVSGVYGWWFSQIPPDVRATGTQEYEGNRLLYVGIAPARVASKSRLRSRIIGCHFCGNASGSTLRLSLGCLLAKSLNIQLRPTGSKGRLTFSDGEKRLTDWMESHAFVSWVEHPEPWLVEEEAIRSLILPLNLDQNQSSGFHSRLSSLRSRSKAEARTGCAQ